MDDLNQVLPVGFLITNHCEKETLVKFFNEIKKNSEPIHSKIFMSDMEDILYEAWEDEMGKADYTAYSRHPRYAPWEKYHSHIGMRLKATFLTVPSEQRGSHT